MAKTAKTADTIEFPNFDPSEATDQFRAYAEKGMEQSKEAYAKMKTNAETAQKTMEDAFQTVKSASDDLSMKSIEAMRANTEANFAHMEALVSVKSLSELMELQTSFLRQRVEAMVDQAKEFQTASTKAAEDVSKPFKGAVEKAVKEVKAAA